MARKPENISPYLKVIDSGEIVRCICYDDQTATVEISNGEVIELRATDVTSPSPEELKLFLERGK